MTSIDGSDLRCNACWKSLLAQLPSRSYKTPCGHIFCRPCAERRFSSTNTCSLCDAALDLESELVELTHERSAEVGLATFALCATFPEEAWRIFVEASVFCRTQTALYGTREIWIRAKETEATKLLLVKAENNLNAACLQLELKTKEVGDAAALSQQQGRTIMELQQQIKMLESRLAPRGGGGGQFPQQQQQQVQQQQLQQQQQTPRLGPGMHMAATPRPSVVDKGGGGGGGFAGAVGSRGPFGQSMGVPSSPAPFARTGSGGGMRGGGPAGGSMGGGGGGGGSSTGSVSSVGSSVAHAGDGTGWQQQQQKQRTHGAPGPGHLGSGSAYASAGGGLGPLAQQMRGATPMAGGRGAGSLQQQMTVGLPARELATPAVAGAGAQMMSSSGQVYTLAQQSVGGGQRTAAGGAIGGHAGAGRPPAPAGSFGGMRA